MTYWIGKNLFPNIFVTKAIAWTTLLFLCCYTYLELHLDFVSNNDLDPDLSFDLDDGIDVFKHDFNCELNLDFDVDHDLDIDLNLVHDYDLQPNVDLGWKSSLSRELSSGMRSCAKMGWGVSSWK